MVRRLLRLAAYTGMFILGWMTCFVMGILGNKGTDLKSLLKEPIRATVD